MVNTPPLIDFANQPINISTIPYDSVRAAHLRMMQDFELKGTYDFADYLIICGDPCQGVSLSHDPGYMMRQFQESVKKREGLLQQLRPYLKQRHTDFLNNSVTN